MAEDKWLHCKGASGTYGPVAEGKVSLEPGSTKPGGGREEQSLDDHRGVHEVAEVKHEEVVVDGTVGGVAQEHEEGQGDLREGKGHGQGLTR